MPANVVAVFEPSYLGFVLFGISLQPDDSLFKRAAKAGTDLKTFFGGAIGHHGKLLGAVIPESQKIISKWAQVFSARADINEGQ
jgi:hypothetical protein